MKLGVRKRIFQFGNDVLQMPRLLMLKGNSGVELGLKTFHNYAQSLDDVYFLLLGCGIDDC